MLMNAKTAFEDAARTLHRIGREIIRENRSPGDAAMTQACNDLVEKCQALFGAEVCAIFIVRDREAVLEAYRGYEHPYGTQIDFATLQGKLRYAVTPTGDLAGGSFDGITGWVASTGKEFGADNWEEIKRFQHHAGKPDRLGIWDDRRPFRCMFAVPLKLDGETVGVLKVENKSDPRKRDATFDDTDKDLMRSLADRFSMAIENIQQAQIPKPEATFDIETPATVDDEALAALAVRFDHWDMASVILRLPTHIEIALRQELPPMPQGPFERVVLTGMGGSALSADVVNDAFADRLRFPIIVSRQYELPPSVDERTLVIASSFSGKTEEVLSSIDALPKNAPNVVILSAGGPLTNLAQARGYPVVRIPINEESKGFQPRSALGYTVTFLARLLHDAGLMDDPASDLSSVPQFLREAGVRPEAEKVAVWLRDKIPVVYADERHLMAIARATKVKFNENSKRPALFNTFPETNHTEMIGFRWNAARFGIVYFHDPDSHPRIRRRFRVMKHVFQREMLDHVGFMEWTIPGATNVRRVFAALMFADWCSYTLALLDGLDPTPVDLIESFKRALVGATES